MGIWWLLQSAWSGVYGGSFLRSAVKGSGAWRYCALGRFVLNLRSGTSLLLLLWLCLCILRMIDSGPVY